jgi:hypothetical protein
LGWVKKVWSKEFEFKGKNLGGYEAKLELTGYSRAISIISISAFKCLVAVPAI